MKKLGNKKMISGAVILILAALFLFFGEGKRTQLSVKEGEESVESQTGEAEEAGNKEENIPEEEAIREADASSSAAADAKESVSSDLKSSPKKSEQEKKSSDKITDALVSWGYQKAENRSIDAIIIHSSYDATSDNPYSYSGILKEYKEYDVSSHYLIDREGKIYRLVEDKNIAYHAGTSKMPDGRTGVNGFSIGVELMNTKTSKFTDKQYASLKYLISYLKGRYGIGSILGHDDIAPDRKDDPWNFDWNRIR